jgi:AcrR family transcriptional regulator
VPPHPRPATARGEATRQRLLDAAEIEFGVHGFHAASITDITQRAGVAQGTFYLYFPSKEEAMRELVRHMGHELRHALTAATVGATDRLAAERLGFETFARFSLRHRNLYRIVMESQFVDEAIYRGYYEALATGYTAGLQRAMDRGEVRAVDAETAAWALMGVAHFVGLRYAIWQEREPPPEALDAVFDVIRRGLEPRS